MERLWIPRGSGAPPGVQVLPSLGRLLWVAPRQRSERWSLPLCPCSGMALWRKPYGPLCGQWLDTSLSGLASSSITCGGIDRADFATTTGLRDTMTPIRAVLFSSSSFAGQVPARIPELSWSYA